MQENLILAYYAQIWKSGPRPSENDFFGNFWFSWKGLWISLLMSPQPPPDIKFKSSYARKLDFSLLCPNMEIRPQAPKKWLFSEFLISMERSPNFASNEPSTTPDIKFKSSYARKLDFSLFCPNMEIGRQAPRKWFFLGNFFPAHQLFAKK